MRSSLLMSVAATGILAALFGMASCSGNSTYNSPAAPAPSTTSPGSPASVTVAIVGTSGSQAFQPNPVKVNAGDTLAFRNGDTNMHHIVLDDGSADLGLLSPGATSAAMKIAGSGVNFHCTIHSTMVGSINGAAAPTPPPCMNPGYCD
jgi:plastocyanin